MDLVEHHESGAGERRVALEATGQDPVGHHLDASGAPDPPFVPGPVADRRTDGLAQQVGHAVGRGSGGESAGFEHDDPLVGEPRLVEQPERHDGGLAGSGWSVEHRVAGIGQRLANRGDTGLDGQVGPGQGQGHRRSLADRSSAGATGETKAPSGSDG